MVGELEHCLKDWEKRGHCTFGQHNVCGQCAAPYLVLKLINGEVIHGEDMPRLTLKNWQERLYKFKEEYGIK